MKATMRYTAVFALMLMFNRSMANESCDLLLQHGITNITRYQSAEHAVAYKWHKHCGFDFNSVSDTRVARATATIFGFGSGSGSNNSSHNRQKLAQWCDEHQEFAQARANLFEEAEILSVPALSSWQQCIAMSRKQINIGFLPNGEHDQFVHFEIDSTHDGNLKYLGIEKKNYSCTERMVRSGGDRVDTNSQPDITNSNIQIDCTRSEPEIVEADGVGKITFDSAYISVNTSGPSFSIAFPQVVSEYYVTPPGAIIPFDSTRCPAGWKVFKEAKGRVLAGASRDMPVASEGGRSDIPQDGTHSHNKRQINGSGFGDDNADNQFETDRRGSHNHAGNNWPPYRVVNYCQRGK